VGEKVYKLKKWETCNLVVDNSENEARGMYYWQLAGGSGSLHVWRSESNFYEDSIEIVEGEVVTMQGNAVSYLYLAYKGDGIGTIQLKYQKALIIASSLFLLSSLLL